MKQMVTLANARKRIGIIGDVGKPLLEIPADPFTALLCGYLNSRRQCAETMLIHAYVYHTSFKIRLMFFLKEARLCIMSYFDKVKQYL